VTILRKNSDYLGEFFGTAEAQHPKKKKNPSTPLVVWKGGRKKLKPLEDYQKGKTPGGGKKHSISQFSISNKLQEEGGEGD